MITEITNKKLYDIDSLYSSPLVRALDESVPSASNTFTDGVSSSSLTSGELIGNTTIQDGYLQSSNYVSATTGWKLTPTSAEINVSTALLSLDIPDTTTANSFHVDSLGNTWWGAVAIGDAVAKILKTGAATFTSVKITGLQSGSSLDGQYISDGTILAGKVNKAIQDWNQTCVFSSTDLDTVSWDAGVITFSDGISYSIDAGDTGNMTVQTYIYLDVNVSTTAYQTTTTATTAVGNGKVLIAVAINDTVSATFQVFGGSGGMKINGNVITANSIMSNQLNVSQLSAITADLGAITAGTVTLDSTGYVRSGQTDFNTGTGFFLGQSGGTSKFSIGSATKKLTWDGTELVLKGSFDVGTSGLINNSVYTVANLPIPPTTVGFNNPSGVDANTTITIDSYSETNQDTAVSGDAGQTFNASIGIPISSVKFYLKRGAGASGNLVAKLYNVTGTYGTTNCIPTGSALATSDSYDISGISTSSFALIELSFTGSNRYLLTQNTKYAVAIDTSGISGNMYTGIDNSSSTHSGNKVAYFTDTWFGYSNDTIFYVYGLFADFTNPTNAYSSNDVYATLPATSGDLSITLSKDAGVNYQSVLTKTFDGTESILTYGNGSTELWGSTWTGADITDANFRLKIYQGGNVQVYKIFGFSITASLILTGIEVAVEAKYVSPTISVDHIKIKIYYGTSTLPIQAGSMVYVSNGRKAGEGAGVGTGVLVFRDASNWIASDTGATVAA